MLYHSTRNQKLTADSAQAVLRGLAPDGGLYMPEALPAFDWQNCIKKSAQEMSAMILSALLPDIPHMDTLVKHAYTGKFESEELTPTVTVGDFHVRCSGAPLPPSRMWRCACCPSCSLPPKRKRARKRTS